jgi:predicted RNase H-like HicB family nuclease
VEVTSQGEAFDQALSNLQEALELYFEDEPFPEGIQPPIIAPINIPA